MQVDASFFATCVYLRASISTQVSTQVQFATTCESVWPGLKVNIL